MPCSINSADSPGRCKTSTATRYGPDVSWVVFVVQNTVFVNLEVELSLQLAEINSRSNAGLRYN